MQTSRRWAIGIAAFLAVTFLATNQRRATASHLAVDREILQALIPPISVNQVGAAAAATPARANQAPGQLQLQAARPVIYLLAVDNGTLFDMDGSGGSSVGDISTLEGRILGANNIVLGSWEANLTRTSGNSVGVVGIRFSGVGSITLAGGSSVSDGIRSGTNCRAICGGTGGYTKLSGNAGFGLDNVGNLIVIFNVK